MSVKKLGRAEIDLEDELWFVKGRAAKYHMNLRLVSSNRELKAARSLYTKITGKGRPPLKKPNKRAEHLRAAAEAKKECQKALAAAYEEVRQESYSYPIPLWMDRDFGRNIAWRFCIYKGVIYQFDKQGYSDEAMLEQIVALEPPVNQDAAE